MSERPTFREYLSEWFDDDMVEVFMDEVAAHGYVIVHPDDVPVKSEEWRGVHVDPTCIEPMQAHGWNACRRHIFGD